MRYHELLEAKVSAAGIVDRIEQDCQPYLQIIGDNVSAFPMYRGMEEHEMILRKQVRLDNRKPWSSAQIKHERYNQYFEDTFGQPFRNSLFVSGDYEMAAYYGAPYAIFPIGKFDWLWSPQVNDMALDIRWPPVGGHVNVPPSQEAVIDKLQTLDYNMNSDLKGAIVTGNEIMIRCKEYYALSQQVFRTLYA